MRKLYFSAAIALLVSSSLWNYSCNYIAKTEVKDSTHARLERGTYLVNVLCNCMHCHADRDFTKYSGPIVPGTEGKGGEKLISGIYSKNITPTVLGSWTDDEIARALTEGIAKNGDTLSPLMPYRDYRYMTRDDIYSIVAYLRKLKPIPNTVPENRPDSLPPGFAATLYKNLVTNHSGEKIPFPSPDDKIKTGAYLINAGHCNGCHTPFDFKMMDFNKEMYLSGGSLFARNGFKVKSANITPDSASGIGTWSEEIFLAKFRSYRNAKTYSYAPGRYNSMMPWTILCNLTDDDLKAIYAYLRSIKPVNNKIEKWPL
jgi:mono/diheme cytochrome c family protein